MNIVFSYTEDLANHVAGVNREQVYFFISDHRTEVLISRDEFDTLEFGGFEFQVYLHDRPRPGTDPIPVPTTPMPTATICSTGRTTSIRKTTSSSH